MFRQIKFCSLLNMHGMYSGPAEIHCGLGSIKYRGFTSGRCVVETLPERTRMMMENG